MRTTIEMVEALLSELEAERADWDRAQEPGGPSVEQVDALKAIYVRLKCMDGIAAHELKRGSQTVVGVDRSDESVTQVIGVDPANGGVTTVCRMMLPDGRTVILGSDPAVPPDEWRLVDAHTIAASPEWQAAVATPGTNGTLDLGDSRMAAGPEHDDVDSNGD